MVHPERTSGNFSRLNGNIGNINRNILLPRAFMRVISILLLAVLLMAGCGSKGPLYLPEKQYPQPQESKPQ